MTAAAGRAANKRQHQMRRALQINPLDHPNLRLHPYRKAQLNPAGWPELLDMATRLLPHWSGIKLEFEKAALVGQIGHGVENQSV